MATADAKAKYSPDEIKEKNKVAFMQMLQNFRAKNSGVLIVGYNGFGGVLDNTYTPFTKTIDARWPRGRLKRTLAMEYWIRRKSSKRGYS